MNKQGQPFRRAKAAAPVTKRTSPERLVSAAIVRDGVTLKGEKSHGPLRNFEPSLCGDRDGFWTSRDRFVTRDEAKVIGEISGQVRPGLRRELLSSDIKW